MAMPITPATADSSVAASGLTPSTAQTSSITISGCTEPNTAANPPGSR